MGIEHLCSLLTHSIKTHTHTRAHIQKCKVQTDEEDETRRISVRSSMVNYFHLVCKRVVSIDDDDNNGK